VTHYDVVSLNFVPIFCNVFVRCYDPLVFEVRLQTYWPDVDAAGIVYYPHFFRFVEHAEEELFRAAGKEMHSLMTELGLWMPRVEVFSKFSKPIQRGMAIRVRLTPELRGQKAIRYNFEIVDDAGSERLAAGYVTVVCVDPEQFRATPIPDAIRTVIQNA
jgi:acyl-CoA thioester hydrolase